MSMSEVYKKEYKILVLQDLCARLPYLTMVQVREQFDDEENDHFMEIHPLTAYDIECLCNGEYSRILPYLRLPSAMTEDERNTLRSIDDFLQIDIYNNLVDGGYKTYDYLNSINVDYRGLIPMGLAIEVTEENNPYKSMKEPSTEEKVESKFRVGDWITNGTSTWKIDSIEDNMYYTNCGGIDCGGDIKSIDEQYHLWTIQDAKDGDVLAWDNSKCIAFFKNIYDEESFNGHGFVGHCTGTFESRLSYHDIEGVHPATKEQSNLLFQKMKESGYRWDKEKLKLEKV